MARLEPWLLVALVGALPTLVGCGAGQPEPAGQPELEGQAVIAADDPLEAQLREVPITMYMARWCPVCQQAQAWLRDGGYRFVEYDVERDPQAAAVLATVNDRGTVPMFEIDGSVVIGFDPRLIRFVLRRAVARRAAGGAPRVAAQ
ncbi:MAG: hypothetical protein JRI68_06235 [Deltaproteobacteria bacterium]|nr:hypothetical protein [Deltaproteobacteria bacterium]